ncbi:HAMP domain-containing sensor histidine kinase [Pedobacter sp. L105]|uniref:sensor histidine kinase n=1 Tax=Pedobacter sp. L105 TaxID=1641871 RepID=UPI00131A7318|nr:HAMP domain-containing sensor histidine kinase [Pedobacter sp. L105]
MILGICCIVTALSLKHSITKKDLLRHEAGILQENLAQKERIVYKFLADRRQMQRASQLHQNENYALNFIQNLRPEGINLLTYDHSTLQFWSSFGAIPPDPEKIKEGSSFVQFPNGWYEVIRKTQGNFSMLFLIEVKNQYSIQNRYLKNGIANKLLANNSLSLASFMDEEVYDILNLDGKLLFEVKLNPSYTQGVYATIQVWLWVIGLFCFALFINSFCAWLVKRGHLIKGTLLLSVFFLAIRFTDLQYEWFNHQFNLEIFSPSIYAESYFLPSLGDFLLNVLAITWVVLFIYTYKEKYRLPYWIIRSKTAGLAFHALLLLVFSGIAFLINSIFFGLIFNSKLNFDITNIVNLSWLSWVCIILLCLVWFNVYLVACISIELTRSLKVTNKQRLLLFASFFLLYFIYMLCTAFTIFFIAYALFLFILAYNIYIQHNKFSIGIFAAIFFSLAFISSVKYLKFNDIKERNNRYVIAERLQSSDDPKVINSIESLGNGISNDLFIADYFKSPGPNRHLALQNYINKTFLDGYLSPFEHNFYEFSAIDSAAIRRDEQSLQHYQNLVKSGSVKISNFFYRLNDTFGYQNYFGIIPIFDENHILGTLVIELKSQQYNYNSQFPEILIDGKLKTDDDYSNYSFAFYNNNKLIKQSGKYTYKLANTDFKGKLGESVIVNDTKQGYSHLIYSASNSKIIVISKEKVDYIVRLAALSFFFLVFIIFSVSVYILIWLLKNIDQSWGGWFNINRSLMINANKILYKTRIQLSIVLSVVATLLIVGWSTFFYIRDEYRKQQEDFIREKIRKVQLSYEKQIFATGIPKNTDQAVVNFDQFADINSAYLNLFSVNGDLLFTSLPKMYDYGIIGAKMGSKAYIYLKQLQRSEYSNPTETIGEFTYSSAYAPIRNAQNQTVAYIGLPYYANEADYQNKIGLFINTLINIYALVFVAIGVLAVFLANQITSPLTFIQESIRKTKLGQRNQPILWSRHDEIGSLIKEYNKMIAALEDSAVKLAKSERESAWREMAKQVAHEIKNPLTPLKLGVQLLEKSWKENDPNFALKFERFYKSFIEQIDSLATIASEFSNFAKMPDTKLEQLLLIPIIEQSRDVFIHTKNAEIYIFNLTNREVLVLGDKDQLLRSFNNLMKNAIEAATMKDKCLIQIKITNDSDYVWVEVGDNGKGIDSDLQEKIFVPNFTTKSSGTGLGLAFVKQAVENAGGTVNFESAEATGTVFYLSFPLVQS